jgi:RNA polymerase sigma-70 factor (sigma-E family)
VQYFVQRRWVGRGQGLDQPIHRFRHASTVETHPPPAIRENYRIRHVNGMGRSPRAFTVTFDDYVRLRGPALVRLARLITGDRHLGEDLVQEVLIRAYPRWSKIRAGGRPDVYLRQMLVNAHISWRRKRSSHEVADGAERVEQPDRADIGAEAVERDAVWRLITQLPANQRITVVLRFYEDLDDNSIAEILGCSPTTVRTHAMRALNALREHVDTTEESRR